MPGIGVYVDKNGPDVFYRDVQSRCIKPYTGDDEVFLSIGIPTYKRGEFLEQAIESALNQRDVKINYEVIVVNNDPEADMSSLIEKYKDVPNISFYVNEKNIGMMGNWNRLLLLSKGKWSAQLHDDDLLKDNYVCEITKILTDKRYSDAGGFFLDRDYMGVSPYYSVPKPPKGIVRIVYKFAVKVVKKTVKSLLCFRYLYRRDVQRVTTYTSLYFIANIYHDPSCGCVFNKENLIADGGWCEEGYPAADWYTTLRFNQKYKIYFVREKLGIYRWQINTWFKIKKSDWTCVRLGLLRKNWQDEKINKMIKCDAEVMNYLRDATVLSPKEAEEVSSYFGMKFTKPSKLRILLFKIRRRLYRLIHNIDWGLWF